MNRDESPLRQLAVFLGIEEGYTDVGGHYRSADDDTLLALLHAMGIPIGNSGEAASQLRRLKELKATRLIQPVIAQREGSPSEIALSLPEGLPLEWVHLSLKAENGEERRWRLPDLEPSECQGVIDGFRVVKCHLTAKDFRLPLGYHRLEVEAGGVTEVALVVSAPPCCPAPVRGWGTSIPTYAIRHKGRDWGTGSYRDLGALTSFTRLLGGSTFGTLPILASFVGDDGVYQGPYLPASRIAWNEAFVDVEALPELQAQDAFAAAARQWLSSPSADSDLAYLGRTTSADLPAILKVKRQVLQLLAKSINSTDSPRRRELETFLEAKPHLQRYAEFRSACDRCGSSWRNWPDAVAGELPSGGVDADYVNYHLYAQFVADRQLSGDSGLYLDLPVGVHPSGFDTWWEPQSFVSGVSGGAPPDGFFAGGQSWGFSPLHPERVRDDGYAYVISYLRHLMTRASMLRIDHVMGLHRLWWVPEGFAADRGAYVRYHSDEMRAIVVLEAHRSETVIVGEDLGTVPAEVRADMASDRMLSSFVFQFESTASDPLPRPRESVFASLGTHDLPTFRSFWNGWDIPERLKNDEITEAEAQQDTIRRAEWRRRVCESLGIQTSDLDEPDEVRRVLLALLSHLASSPEAILMVDLDDLMLETVRQNTPGTDIAEGNFSRRTALTLEVMTTDEFVLEALRTVDEARADPERWQPK